MEKTNWINSLYNPSEGPINYHSNAALLHRFYDDEHFNALVQSVINLAEGKPVLESIKTPFKDLQGKECQFIKYQEIVDYMDSPKMYGKNFPFIDDAESNFTYVVVFWNKDKNQYELHHIEIALRLLPNGQHYPRI
ncbi:hypothetical protein [Candidatus Clostridium stratigraminis]|uniref:Uncharacterized protein n=1 Tax=Candidatus Clostridium stratigraminis TaxID=3381661 RepID=A0ABW8T662_9CLOT